MSQTLSIGGLTMDDDACWFTINRRGITGGTNRLNYIRNTWDIHGRVNSLPGQSGAAAQATVDAKVVALESHVNPGIDIVFSLGSSASLLSSNTVQGTQIREFSWLPGYDGVRGSGAEGLLRRTFHLVVYGDVLAHPDTYITQWFESITSLGNGGPKTKPVGSLSGFVQAQQIQAVTPYFAIQSGFAVGLLSRPNAPLAIFNGRSDAYYEPESMNTSPFTPRNWGVNRNTEFGIRWSYRCWSTSPLLGTPTIF
jgi:hypothetical protein